MSEPSKSLFLKPGDESPDHITLVEVRSPSDSRSDVSVPNLTLPPPGQAGPNTKLGDYEVLEEVGRGGMGVVYKARHTRLQRLCALKMILGGGLATDENLQRFETEAAAAASLQHPGIVGVYEVGALDNQPFLSMEFISGKNLSQRLAEGTLPGRQAAIIMDAIARAVHFAHQHGIVHRDLKPANVLLDEYDRPKVTDFGLAKVLDTDSEHTRTGSVLGTPSYMSPEQATGSREMGPATDIFSLGAIFYELLTGRPPFRGESALATLTLVRDTEPVAPRLQNPHIDRDLETICLRCLEKSPTRRYPTAEALADDCLRYLENVPIHARRHGWLSRAIKWCRRKPAQAALIGVVMASVLSFLTFLWIQNKEEVRLRQKAEDAEKLAVVRQDSMRHLLYLAEVRRVQHALEAADLDRAERLLKRWLPRHDSLRQSAEETKELRDWEWYFLKERCRGKYFLDGHKGQASAVVYRPDGVQIASAGGDAGKAGEIKLWSSVSGRLQHVLKGHTGFITSLAFSSDNLFLASAGYDRMVILWDPSTGKELARFPGHAGAIHAIAFAPDRMTLASAGADKSIRIWDLSSLGKVSDGKALSWDTDAEINALAYSPDGKLMVSGGLDRKVHVWNPKNGESIRTMSGHEGEIDCLAFSGQGKILASGGGPGSRRGEIKLWDPYSGKLLQNRYGLSDRVRAVGFSRAGMLAAATEDGMIRIWDQANSSEPLAFRADTQHVHALAFSPDGDHLATAGRGGRINIWNSSGGLETLNLSLPGQGEQIAFSLDGKRMAAVGRFGVKLWRLDRTEPAITWKTPVSMHALAFAPDRSILAVAGADQVVRLYDYEHPDTAPIELKGHELSIRTLAFSPKGDLLASGSEDDTIRLWNANSGQLDRVLKGHTNGVLSVAFNSDGSLLASGSFDKTLRVWDLEDGVVQVFKGHAGSVNSVAFSTFGNQVATGSSDKTIRLWDLTSGKEEWVLEGSPSPIVGVAFHQHGRRLASAGKDNTVRLWDLITRQEILVLDGAGLGLSSIAFSPDCRRLAGVGLYAARVWDAGLAAEAQEMVAR